MNGTAKMIRLTNSENGCVHYININYIVAIVPVPDKQETLVYIHGLKNPENLPDASIFVSESAECIAKMINDCNNYVTT